MALDCWLAWPGPRLPKSNPLRKKNKKKKKEGSWIFQLFIFSFFHFFVFSPLGQSGDEKNEKMKNWKIQDPSFFFFFFLSGFDFGGLGPGQPSLRPAQPGARLAQPGASPAGRCPANQSAGRQVGWPARLVGVGFPVNSLEFPLGL